MKQFDLAASYQKQRSSLEQLLNTHEAEFLNLTAKVQKLEAQRDDTWISGADLAFPVTDKGGWK